MDGDTTEQLRAMRHSLAHIMASAIKRLWPQVKLGVGPVVENGFYYDLDLGNTKLSDVDFPKIETEMKKIIAEDQPFERLVKSIDDAIAWAKAEDQPYKLELLNDLKRAGTTVAKDLDSEELGLAAGGDSEVSEASFYKNGDFTDLCRGPHVASTGEVGAFALQRISGAYWRGKESNPQMQRIYGVAFATDKELRQYLVMLEEAKKRDHRKLGQELDLFFFHATAPGMPYWLPKGVVLYNELIAFWREEHVQRDYQEIVSPLLNKKELYVTSGHFEHYWDDMFTTQETPEGELYGMKAMNCPNAMIVFGSRQRSYRELPLRLSERFYSIFNMEYSFRLGTRPDKFMGGAELWDKAEATLKSILERSGRNYFIEEGDGAFYGPKIDILMKDVLGRPWQMGTIQLDFQQPLRFGLSYIDNEGQDRTPIAIHRVIYGSLERFIGILIEHTAGRFPVWLAPEQIRIATVNQEDDTLAFAQKVAEQAKELGLRVTIDNDSESVGKKIRSAELMKIPYTIVVGEKEMQTRELTPRIRSDMVVSQQIATRTVDEFVKTVAHEAKSRVSKTSL